MQQVLTVPADSVECLYKCRNFYDDGDSIALALRAIREHGMFVDRQNAEENSSLRQIVACAVVRSDRLVLCLRRSRKNDRSVLRLRYTLLMGGHVDTNDSDGQSVLENCVKRELAEELGVRSASDPQLLGIVADPRTAVGSIHLGVVFEATVETGTIDLARDNDTSEFVYAGKQRTVELVGIDRVFKLKASLDPWSQLFLGGRWCRELLGDQQLLLPFVS